MWWAGSKPCDVYVGTRAFAACHGPDILATETADGIEASLDTLRHWLAESAPKRLNLWLSGGLCRPMLMAPVDGLKTRAEWLRVAESMVPAHTGLVEPCDVWLENRGRTTGRRVAAAVPKALLASLQDTMQRMKSRPRIARIAPWWCEPLRGAAGGASPTKALAVRDCDSLTLLTGQAQAWASVALYAPVLDDAAAQSTLYRALMNVDAAPGEALVARLRVGGSVNQGERVACALGPLVEWSR